MQKFSFKITIKNIKNIHIHNKSMVENEPNANHLFLEYKPIRRANE